MNSSTPHTVAQIRGLARLGVQATQGIVGLVEQMHRTISDRALPWGPPRTAATTGITGTVYRSIRGTTGLVGQGLEHALRWLEGHTPPGESSARREAVLAAVNGIWGDHLAASANPLAIPMRLRPHGHATNRRVAVLLHGLCMNHLQWRRAGHHHGDVLQALGWQVHLLHYNTGLPVAESGRQLAALLDGLHAQTGAEQLALVGHSMGGLVARSAIAQGEHQPWRQQLSHLVCLGTPHEGALLERGGRLLDSAFDLSPYLAPFTRLGRSRSAGINDLADGAVRAPLPAGVKVGLLAATTQAAPRGLRHALIGDGLVTVASAWGEHRDPARALHLPASHKRLITQANHWDLLNHPQAAEALRDWLG